MAAARSAKVRTPVQERSRITVERIVTAAEELVAEGGLSHFTTGAVAERAGVNIATLYAYFPDKIAIVRELVRRYEAQRSTFVTDQVGTLTAENWRAVVAASLQRLAEFRVHHPGGMALRRAVVGTPELRELDLESTEASAKSLARWLLTANPRLSPADAQRVGLTTIITGTEMLDHVCASGRIDRKLLTEVTELITLYLEAALTRR